MNATGYNSLGLSQTEAFVWSILAFYFHYLASIWLYVVLSIYLIEFKATIGNEIVNGVFQNIAILGGVPSCSSTIVTIGIDVVPLQVWKLY